MIKNRDISLCNVGNKLIAKCTSNRLINLLSKIVLDCQSVYVKGRLILNNIIVAFETLHSTRDALKERSRKNP